MNLVHFLSFLGALAKLRQTIIGFIMSVHLSERVAPTGRFSWNMIFEHFSKNHLRKNQISLKSDKNNGHFT